MNKEKVFAWIERLENMADQSDRYFVERTELYKENQAKDKEIERLKNGYCELKVKCNNGECDCTNEEYDGMVQCNMKLSLENDELRNILEKMGTNPNEILYLKNEVDELNNIMDEFEKELDNLIMFNQSNINCNHYTPDDWKNGKLIGNTLYKMKPVSFLAQELKDKLKALKEESHNGKDNKPTSK